jgi:uncharacterized membrane-anchored protein YhcB (DUF1043 family)
MSWKAYAIAIFIGVALGIIFTQPTCELSPCPTNLFNLLPVLGILIFVAIIFGFIISDYWQEAEPERLQEAAKLKAERQRIDEELKKRGESV